MTFISYSTTSPYSSTPQLSWRIDRFVFRPIPPGNGDTLYTLKPRHQYRPDTLAYDLYQNASYWWVFCERNPFLRADPIWNFVPGLQIMVPSLSYLNQILGT